MNKTALSIAVGSLLLSQGQAALAAVSEAEFEALKAQFAAMSERMTALEAENERLQGLTAKTVPVIDLDQEEVDDLRTFREKASWTEKTAWKGDFRYRYEEIDAEFDDDGRSRHRIRARAALVSQLPSNVEVGLGLATGGDDPVSTNQTLGGGGSTKEIRLDLAYFKWSATEHISLQAGKYKNPWREPQKSALLFDGDYRPEGLHLLFENEHFFAQFEGTWIESDSRNDDGDDFAWGVQGGTSFGPFNAAIGYLEWPTRGRRAIFDAEFFGNSSVGNSLIAQRYLYNYDTITAAADLTFDVADLPLSFYVDYVHNTDADDLDTGYLAGVKLGKTKRRGSWHVQYQYQVLEADATLGLVTDSDFAGGGTDNKGHKISGKYAINDRWQLGVTYFDTQRGVDLGDNEDYKRLMLDTEFKY